MNKISIFLKLKNRKKNVARIRETNEVLLNT